MPPSTRVALCGSPGPDPQASLWRHQSLHNDSGGAGTPAQGLEATAQRCVTADPSCDHRCMEVASINALAAEQLAKATTVGSGRSSVTVYGRSGARLRQTLVA